MRLWHPEPKFYLNDKFFLKQATGLHHSSRAGQAWVVHKAQLASHKGAWHCLKAWVHLTANTLASPPALLERLQLGHSAGDVVGQAFPRTQPH